MGEPWDTKSHSERRSEGVEVFIVFCEDGAVEPAYLQTFRSPKVQISCIPNVGQHHQNVDHATNFLRKKGMLEVTDGKEVLKFRQGTQVWCMFDRDKDARKDDGKDTAFNDSIAAAIARGIGVAWSNDNFELWVLLHFIDVDPLDEALHHREGYYAQLEVILRAAYSPESPEGQKVHNPLFTYRNSLKSGTQFSRLMLPLMNGRTQLAISRAKQLEMQHDHPTKIPHLKVPCTMVHHLCLSILGAM
jgi:RloB-like protein